MKRRQLKWEEQEFVAIIRSPQFLGQNLYTYVCFSGLLCEIWKYVGGRRMVKLKEGVDIVLRYNHWTANRFTIENWRLQEPARKSLLKSDVIWVLPGDSQTFEVFFDSFKRMGGKKVLNQAAQVMECAKICVLSFFCIGELSEGEAPYWHSDEEGGFTIMVPIWLPNTRKPELLLKRGDSVEEYYEIPYTYQYKMSEVVIWSVCTKHASNRIGSSGECLKVMLSLVVKEYREGEDD